MVTIRADGRGRGYGSGSCQWHGSAYRLVCIGLLQSDLAADEFLQYGPVLDEILEDGSETHSAVAAIRLLMLTGCRLSEIQKLRWEHVDLDAGELRLPDTKTGGRAVPLAPSAVRLLSALPRDDKSPWVIAGRNPGGHLTDLQHPWRRIRARAGLDDVRIHDLRHSCASLPYSLAA